MFNLDEPRRAARTMLRLLDRFGEFLGLVSLQFGKPFLRLFEQRRGGHRSSLGFGGRQAIEQASRAEEPIAQRKRVAFRIQNLADLSLDGLWIVHR
ncbi:MAG: hypothetical protein KY476_03865 [Planctomycetes bacterium]|nr:hypothetical protein [Planctomycetota bacterium]